MIRRIVFLIAGAFALVHQPAAAETSLTICNDNFAIVRETIKLHLQAGLNEIRQGPVADHAEPNSVVLRDITGHNAFAVVEQKFTNAGLTSGMLRHSKVRPSTSPGTRTVKPKWFRDGLSVQGNQS